MQFWIFTFISTALINFIKFLMTWFTRKTAQTLGYAVAFLTIINALVVVFLALLSSISHVIPEGMIRGASLVVPDNAPLCVSVVLSARIALYVYSITIKRVAEIYRPGY